MKADYRIVKIPKGHGRVRTIYVPGAHLKARIREVFQDVREQMLSCCDLAICHGFMPGRSPFTNAAYHVGYQYTLSMDLQDFFDSVTEAHLRMVPQKVRDLCLIEGAPRQGLPTSPMLANIAAAAMDRAIVAALLETGQHVRYTRYADDLTFSGNDRALVQSLERVVVAVVESHGFQVNPRKTQFQGVRAGRRLVTGLAVDDGGVYVPREVRRKARVAAYQGRHGAAEGLRVWANPPRRRCPICWTAKVYGFFGYHIADHFRHCYQSWEARRDIENQIEGIINACPKLAPNTKAKDYARAYTQIRQLHAAALMGGAL